MHEPGTVPHLSEAPGEKIEGQYPDSPVEPPMLYCPVCSTRLVSLRCKLVCEECGYFMSCADYY